MLKVYMRLESNETNSLKKSLSNTSEHREVPEPKLAGVCEKYCVEVLLHTFCMPFV